jgi:hypothetical protein
MLQVYRQPRRRPPIDTIELQRLIDEARREHARRSPEEATSITAAAISQWTTGTRPLRVFPGTKGRSA